MSHEKHHPKTQVLFSIKAPVLAEGNVCLNASLVLYVNREIPSRNHLYKQSLQTFNNRVVHLHAHFLLRF